MKETQIEQKSKDDENKRKIVENAKKTLEIIYNKRK